MNTMNPTCFFTGKKENLLMYAHRNANGDMVGWVFVHDDVEMLNTDLHLHLVDPHLLNEGELLAADKTAISGQNNEWGEVAEEMMSKYSWWRDEEHSLAKCCFQADAITALTEMAELAYEKGSKESYRKWKRYFHRYAEAQQEVYDLQKQLTEKERDIKDFILVQKVWREKEQSLQSELAAAKAEVERLKNNVKEN